MQSQDAELEEGFQHLQNFNKSIDTKQRFQSYPDPSESYGYDASHDLNGLGIGIHGVSASRWDVESRSSTDA
jgi:hypothetical protein